MGRDLTNSAVENFHRERELLFRDRDIDAVVANWVAGAPFTMHDHSGHVIFPDQLAEWNEDVVNHPDDINWSTEVVAIRDDHLCLLRTRSGSSESGFGNNKLRIHEINDAGLATRGARFADDDLNAAHDLLNDWWIESLPVDLARVVSLTLRVEALATAVDRDALDELIADSIRVVDHRPLKIDESDKTTLFDYLDARQEFSPYNVVTTIERLTANGLVAVAEAQLDGGYVNNSIVLQIHEDGIITNWETFPDPEGLDAALARFDELTSGDV